MEGEDWSDNSLDGSFVATEVDKDLSDAEEIEPPGSVNRASKRTDRSLPLTQAISSPSPVRSECDAQLF